MLSVALIWAVLQPSLLQHRLLETIRWLPEKRAALGDVEHQQGLARTEGMLVERLLAMGLTVTLEPIEWNIDALQELNARAAQAARETGLPHRAYFVPESTTPELASRAWHNIIVDFPATVGSSKDVLIFGAHFDAVDGSPGADDNGSGTAALFEIARTLKADSTPRRTTVRLIFFNLEEIGLKGAVQHVENRRERWKAGAERVVGMVSLEMLGYYCTEAGCQDSPVPSIPGVFEAPTRGDMIALVTTRAARPFNARLAAAMENARPQGVLADWTPQPFRVDFPPVAPPDFMRSDHGPFLVSGVPAVMMTDTANFRNPHYHAATDRVETLDTKRFTMLVWTLRRAVVELAR